MLFVIKGVISDNILVASHKTTDVAFWGFTWSFLGVLLISRMKEVVEKGEKKELKAREKETTADLNQVFRWTTPFSRQGMKTLWKCLRTLHLMAIKTKIQELSGFG